MVIQERSTFFRSNYRYFQFLEAVHGLGPGFKVYGSFHEPFYLQTLVDTDLVTCLYRLSDLGGHPQLSVRHHDASYQSVTNGEKALHDLTFSETLHSSD